MKQIAVLGGNAVFEIIKAVTLFSQKNFSILPRGMP